MSVQKFSVCCKQLSARKTAILQTTSTIRYFEGFKPRLQEYSTRNSNQNGFTRPETNFSTIARPHLSRSLQQWKKRKRKSQAQRKRELETLQKDFAQILTKRVVQLLRDDSHQFSNSRVVNTHSFTSQTSQLDIESLNVLATRIESFNNWKSDVDLSERFNGRETNLTLYPQHTSKFLPFSQRPDKEIKNVKQSNMRINDGKVSFSSLVENYLKEKYENDSRALGISSEHFHQKHTSQFTTSANVFPSSQKIKLNVLDKLKSSQSSKPYDTSSMQPVVHDSSHLLPSEFLNLFQDGLVKSVHGIRHWEHLEEIHQETITELIDVVRPENIEIETEIVSSDSIQSESSTSNSFEHLPQRILERPEEPLNEERIQSNPKVDRLTYKNELDSLFPVVEKDSKRLMTLGKKKRQKKTENKEFQEITDMCFIDACCFTGNELLAVRNIEFQSSKHTISSIDIFNILTHALAKKQNLDTIKSLFTLLREENVAPTLQTYAGCLECIGRMSQPDSFLCERLLIDIEKAGFDVGDIANSCSFESDEWDYVLKAIRIVNPDFSPNPPPPEAKYTNEMLLPLDTENLERVEKNQYALKMTKPEMMDRLRRQLEMEKKGSVEVISVAEQADKSIGDSQKLAKLREQVKKMWKKALIDSFTDKLKTHEKKAHSNMCMTLYPYLKLFKPEAYVDIIFKSMQELFSSSEAYSPSQDSFLSSMGLAVNRMYNIESRIVSGLANKVVRMYDQFSDDYLDKDYPLDNHRRIWKRAMNAHPDTINLDTSLKRWPKHVTKMVGKFLLDLVLYDLKIDANMFKSKKQHRYVPAFCTIYRPDVSTFTVAEIKVHPVASKLFKMDVMETFQFDPSTVPMLVPPVPWISKYMGGLLLGGHSLIRMGNDLYHLDALKNVEGSQYVAILDSLNTLSACAWKMNKRILDLQIKIFKANGDDNLKVSPPASVLPLPPTIKAGMSGHEKAAVYRQRVQLQHQKRDMHGLWCSDLYRLSIANKFRDEIFWFPHSIDFRGRTYPLPPHFNHLGSDNVRGMLLFAKGKSLGTKGHDWLKIHIINLTGFKKRSSNEERLAYADSIMDDILDSAENPLTGKKWWMTSDEPWQTLACCMELAEIERFDGNKEDYISHFPVHQDGSCNGLQHYAALGRDQAGAESVNLMPFNSPQDVYSDVVELVERERKKDAEDGHDLAKALEGFVKRKVIKQTIMTTVYGVTRFGAKAQIHKQLKDIPDFPSDLAWKASFYLTEKTFSSLREMFTATKDIQDWLTDAAQLISAFKPVDWVTPLGFPVVQPYFKRCTDSSRNMYTSKPNTMKQKNAFPPNYIHSLDSTHMMLTSLFCMREGITFVSVHDCYWTHACDVPIMNKVCREQFVSMHKQPLLEDLSNHLLNLVQHSSVDPSLGKEFKKVDKSALNSLLADVPKRGTFDLDEVLKSTYFFS